MSEQSPAITVLSTTRDGRTGLTTAVVCRESRRTGRSNTAKCARVSKVGAQNQGHARWLISSSAVAKRPRDASCLSVISFNSTIRRFECNLLLLVTSAGDLPLRTNDFCSLVFSSSRSSMLAVMNKIHWCLAVYAVNCTVGIVDRTATVNRYSSIIAIFTYSTRIRRPCWRGPRRNIAIMFGMEKTSGASTRRWKQTEDTFTDFDRLYESSSLCGRTRPGSSFMTSSYDVIRKVNLYKKLTSK